jgi:hypothetical protein
MSQAEDNKPSKPQLISSARPYFAELVETAVTNRRFQAPPTTQNYLVNLLEHYLLTGNMELHVAGDQGNKRATMAEVLLTAANAEPPVRVEMLKRLGDTSLYISGFFGDSLQRKLVDIEYYAGIGGTAYGTLAGCVTAEPAAPVFRDLAKRFLDYVELLTYISQQAMVQTHEDLLRLYERYLMTGSKLAEEQLIEKGVLSQPAANKATKQ